MTPHPSPAPVVLIQHGAREPLAVWDEDDRTADLPACVGVCVRTLPRQTRRTAK